MTDRSVRLTQTDAEQGVLDARTEANAEREERR